LIERKKLLCLIAISELAFLRALTLPVYEMNPLANKARECFMHRLARRRWNRNWYRDPKFNLNEKECDILAALSSNVIVLHYSLDLSASVSSMRAMGRARVAQRRFTNRSFSADR
jgi:hypothetical protein